MTWTQAVRIQSRQSQAKRRAISVVTWRVLVLIAVLLAWWIVAYAELLSSSLVPNPIAVGQTLVSLLVTSGFWHAVGATLGGAMLGLAFAILIGIPLGVLSGRFWRVEKSIDFFVDFGRAFPRLRSSEFSF